jgi:hypothetical protein
MAADSNAVEQAVSRALRDNLGRIQRTAEELNQAIGDMVSACSSSRATNALPAMLRAHSSAASLAATLEVLTRFVTSGLQPSLRSPFEQEIQRLASSAVEPPPLELPPLPELPPLEVPPAVERSRAERAPVHVHEPVPEPEIAVEPSIEIEPEEAEPAFSLASLPADEQELHRRAYRVAKVSMQDIKLLRPEDVREGRENHDLCVRLREDIEKAHKEYDRRFQAIQSHPVDYFYDWMVEILAGGNPEALGEYPYPSPVLRR